MLGCAGIAWRRTLPAFADSRQAEVVAVASRDPGKAARFAERFGCDAVTGYERLLDRPDVEAVYLPLPTGLHAEWCERALRAGKHVLAEKPLATTAEEAGHLARLAGERGLVLRENRMFAHHTQHETVAKLLADGTLGELRVFSSTMAFPPLPATDVRYRPELGGGALLDAGYYPIQAALLLVPGELEVLGAALHRDPASGVDVRGSVLLGTSDGVTAQLTFGFEHSYRSSYELWGSQGRLTLERAFTPPQDWRPVLHMRWQDRAEDLTLSPCHQFLAAIDAFAAAVRVPDPQQEREHLRTAVRGAELVDAVRAQNRNRE
ncbi:NDP-hexose-3-ketoreductase [Streptomyces zhaozhouensis]|uniref:NDP-hexose-3-ketoreductase n=1 Tax=Streptomyces zhaozhouensis TaxID=1300267 RepID=A0A286DLS4_9ACTN|nr:Gfo/Idh/MocA family oxidoreductase [Streptomyces zhaozhouensis]SOD59563.1 NDP-hexose-3-ketoreductase [Streptomyces zhaozhouensis]